MLLRTRLQRRRYRLFCFQSWIWTGSLLSKPFGNCVKAAFWSSWGRLGSIYTWHQALFQRQKLETDWDFERSDSFWWFAFVNQETDRKRRLQWVDLRATVQGHITRLRLDKTWQYWLNCGQKQSNCWIDTNELGSGWKWPNRKSHCSVSKWGGQRREGRGGIGWPWHEVGWKT